MASNGLILVAEDNAAARGALKGLPEGAGYRVTPGPRALAPRPRRGRVAMSRRQRPSVMGDAEAVTPGNHFPTPAPGPAPSQPQV
jgi:hypothetical protein